MDGMERLDQRKARISGKLYKMKRFLLLLLGKIPEYLIVCDPEN